MDAYATPTYDTDYSYHIKAIEHIQPIICSLYHPTSHHKVLIASGVDIHTHTHTHTNTHTYRRLHRNNSKKSGTPRPVAGVRPV